MKLIHKQVAVIDHIAVGVAMRHLREKRGISLREMGKRLKLSAPYISDLERGNRNWTQDRIDRFEKAVLR